MLVFCFVFCELAESYELQTYELLIFLQDRIFCNVKIRDFWKPYQRELEFIGFLYLGPIDSYYRQRPRNNSLIPITNFCPFERKPRKREWLKTVIEQLHSEVDLLQVCLSSVLLWNEIRVLFTYEVPKVMISCLWDSITDPADKCCFAVLKISFGKGTLFSRFLALIFWSQKRKD